MIFLRERSQSLQSHLDRGRPHRRDQKGPYRVVCMLLPLNSWPPSGAHLRLSSFSPTAFRSQPRDLAATGPKLQPQGRFVLGKAAGSRGVCRAYTGMYVGCSPHASSRPFPVYAPSPITICDCASPVGARLIELERPRH